MVLRWTLLVPAVLLSLRFGAGGACIGGITSSVALFLTVPHQEAGLSDESALLVQEAFAFVSCMMLVLGAALDQHRAESQRAIQSEREARRMATTVIEANEVQMRDRAARAAELQATSRENARSTIDWLKQNGHSEVALGLVAIAHDQARAFQQIITDSLYPLILERDGLYAALEADAFRLQFDAAGVDCNVDLRGGCRSMPMELQRIAYRLIGEAVAYLLHCTPMCLQVRVRCLTIAGRATISVALYAREPRATSRSPIETARLAQLRTHAGAYNATVHSRPHRLRMILASETPTNPDPKQPRRMRPTLRVISDD